MNRLILGCAAFLFAAAQAPAQQASSSGAAGRPSLVVLITIDQMRPDYIDRFGAQLHGGLARLKAGGALFTNAFHDHGITETAPGHATLLSGRFPRSTGISNNSAGVSDSLAALIGSPNGPGASPRRFRGTTLVDWLTAGDKRTRALSVSMKDRAAILPIGRSQQSIYWYVLEGNFTTSRYYADTLPTWVQQFNARHLARNYAGKSWSLMLPASEYPERDSVDFEGAGQDYVFPHLLPSDSAQAASLVRVTPFMDVMTAALALDGVQALGLGKGPQTDVLAMSLSATDLIGHRYGPDSREMHDNILELDRTLGVFLDSLYKMRDSSRIAVVLTADHGIGSIPEIASRTIQPLPERVDLFAVLTPIRTALAPKKLDTSIGLDGHVLWVDRAAFKAAGVNADSVIKVFADAARQTPGVARVDNFKSLLADTLKDPIARRWMHQFNPGDPEELMITLTPYSISTGIVATHGSPYDYDAHVPLIFYGPWFRVGRYEETVRTVDIAPTLAVVAGVKPSERLDGVVLTRALK